NRRTRRSHTPPSTADTASATGPPRTTRTEPASGRGRLVVNGLGRVTEVRAEHHVRQERVPEAVHRLLHTRSRRRIERAEPRPATGTTGHVAVHAVIVGQQRIGERAPGAVGQRAPVVRVGGRVSERVHLLTTLTVER